METGRQRFDIAVGGDEVVAHVVRMRGRVTHAPDSRDRGGRADEGGKSDRAAMAVDTMIGVDVLSDQRHFAHARTRETRNLVDDRSDRTRDLRPARIGHDAK